MLPYCKMETKPLSNNWSNFGGNNFHECKRINCNLPSLVNSSEYCHFSCSTPDLIEETIPLNSFRKHKIVKGSSFLTKELSKKG